MLQLHDRAELWSGPHAWMELTDGVAGQDPSLVADTGYSPVR